VWRGLRGSGVVGGRNPEPPPRPSFPLRALLFPALGRAASVLTWNVLFMYVMPANKIARAMWTRM
jgi:hypothetical protein